MISTWWPFSFHAILLDEIIVMYEIWRQTVIISGYHLIVEIVLEQRTSKLGFGARCLWSLTSWAHPHLDYVTVHRAARHARHSMETLVVAVETMASMIQEHEAFYERTPRS